MKQVLSPFCRWGNLTCWSKCRQWIHDDSNVFLYSQPWNQALHFVLQGVKKKKEFYGHMWLGNAAHWIHTWEVPNAHPHIKSFEKYCKEKLKHTFKFLTLFNFEFIKLTWPLNSFLFFKKQLFKSWKVSSGAIWTMLY